MIHMDIQPINGKEKVRNERDEVEESGGIEWGVNMYRSKENSSCEGDEIVDQGINMNGVWNNVEEVSQLEHTVDDTNDYSVWSDEEPEGIEDIDQDCEQDQDKEQENGNSELPDLPLYNGATITVKITMTLLLTFAVRHKLSNETLSDLLHIIDLICPKPNLYCKSVYKFKSYFSFLATPMNLLLLPSLFCTNITSN